MERFKNTHQIEKKMKSRQKFNEKTRNVGNRIYDGLGDILTRNVNLGEALAVSGGISVPLTYAHFLTESMYKSGVVDRMYSDNFIGRMVGTIESIPYEVNWLMALVPLVLIGAGIGGKIGRVFDRI